MGTFKIYIKGAYHVIHTQLYWDNKKQKNDYDGYSYRVYVNGEMIHEG